MLQEIAQNWLILSRIATGIKVTSNTVQSTSARGTGAATEELYSSGIPGVQVTFHPEPEPFQFSPGSPCQSDSAHRG